MLLNPSFQRQGADAKAGIGLLGWHFCCFDYRNLNLCISGCFQPGTACPHPQHPRLWPSPSAAESASFVLQDATGTPQPLVSQSSPSTGQGPGLGRSTRVPSDPCCGCRVMAAALDRCIGCAGHGERNLGVHFKGIRAPGGFEKEPVGSQRRQCGLLLANPAERQGKQLRVCLMAGGSASAAFAAPILQHLCWFAGARK